MQGYWFKSSKFAIEHGEDEDINPGRYGRQLAHWLKAQLEQQGYSVEDVINEDWGRCLMCARRPFMLWIGCGNVTDEETAPHGDALPAKEDIIWNCFVTAEVLFWKRLFQTIDTKPATSRLYADLGEILRSEPQITLVQEP